MGFFLTCDKINARLKYSVDILKRILLYQTDIYIYIYEIYIYIFAFKNFSTMTIHYLNDDNKLMFK